VVYFGRSVPQACKFVYFTTLERSRAAFMLRKSNSPDGRCFALGLIAPDAVFSVGHHVSGCGWLSLFQRFV
jgi:hypothetical protein